MLYPRTTILNGQEVLVDDSQIVGYKEHMMCDHRTLFLNSIIGSRCLQCGASDNDLPNLLLALDYMSHEPIRLMINSPGGDLDATFLLCDTMKLIKSPVETIGRFCASAACLVLASGSRRYLYPHAKTMLHLATGQMGGDYKDFAIQHKLMVNYQTKIIDILHDAGVKRGSEEILADIDRDFWMEPQEAIDYGLADEIVTSDILSGC